MLREINHSVNRRSSYSELAMISLLNSNLSVKYSLTGHLASTDIISDGFYDAGKVCALLQIMCYRSLFNDCLISRSVSHGNVITTTENMFFSVPPVFHEEHRRINFSILVFSI